MKICVTRDYLYQALAENDTANQYVCGIQDAEVLVSNPNEMSEDNLQRMPSCRLLISIATGIDAVDHDYISRHHLKLIRAEGVYAQPIGEYIAAAVSMIAVGFPVMHQNQQQKKYIRYKERIMLKDAVVGFLGAGDIARQGAVRLQGFGCRMIGYKRSAVSDIAPYEKMYYPDQLKQFLNQCDYMVIAMDLNDSNRGLVDGSFLKMMKPTAWLINIARGPIVRQNDLIEALADKTIAGAVLDVFEQEPLPADSPLWNMDNVIITPHTSGTYVSNHQDVIAYVKKTIAEQGQ